MTHDSHSTALTASVALVLGEIKHIKGLRRSARTKLLQFAIDVSLVAHGVRSGYLVDAVCPPNPIQTFTALLMALRDKSSAFKTVVWWHHTPTVQSFLVHVPLLQNKITSPPGGTLECIFVKLDECLSVSREPPHRLQEALRDVKFSAEKFPDSLSLPLPDTFTEEILVPLAAIMIDYPVAYIPTSSRKTPFLQRETLDVYTVSCKWITTSDSTWGLWEEHILLKFSCPQTLVIDHPELSPSTMIEKLRIKFTARLERIGMHCFVSHHTQTLDRIAL